MGNHAHILLIAKDSEACKRFYTELQKKITDCIKRLLGINNLKLWQGRPNVALIADIDTAVDRIAYLYGNPSRADLVDSIEDYPGYSSYTAFRAGISKLDYKEAVKVPWIRLNSIEPLPRSDLSRGKTRSFVQDLKIQPRGFIL